MPQVAAIKAIEFPPLEEKINFHKFSLRYPSSQFPNAHEIKSSKIPKAYFTTALDIPYHQPSLDTQAILTQAKIDKNYFIDKNGKKKRYRKKLRNTLIISGAILSLFYMGIPVLLTGLLLPHPNRKSKVVYPYQDIKMTKKDKGFLGIALRVLIILLLIFSFFALMALILSGF